MPSIDVTGGNFSSASSTVSPSNSDFLREKFGSADDCIFSFSREVAFPSSVYDYAVRLCGKMGLWANNGNKTFSERGYTYFDNCFTPEIKVIYDTYYAGKSLNEVDAMTRIVRGTRFLEVTGLSVSLISLMVSIIIFARFRSLRCGRTQIHLNLFIAMFCHVFIRLFKYVDEGISRMLFTEGSYSTSLSNRAVLCQLLHILVEYSTNAAFMWMFLEGFYLHARVVLNAFRQDNITKRYYAVGWLLPLITVAIWSTVELNRQLISNSSVETINCWMAYSFRQGYWILEAPRIIITLTNTFFLLNVIKVLVTKLKTDRTTEMFQYTRKAVRAAFLLLPLLGIPNIVNMVQAPQKDVIALGIWSYSAHFMTTFQGFFVALLYCFCNNEVQSIAKRKWVNCWQSLDNTHAPNYIRRLSRIAANVVERPMPAYSVDLDIRIGSSLSARRRATVGPSATDRTLNQSEVSLNIGLHVIAHSELGESSTCAPKPKSSDVSKTFSTVHKYCRHLKTNARPASHSDVVLIHHMPSNSTVTRTSAAPKHNVVFVSQENIGLLVEPPPDYSDAVQDIDFEKALKPNQLVKDESMEFIDFKETDSIPS